MLSLYLPVLLNITNQEFSTTQLLKPQKVLVLGPDLCFTNWIVLGIKYVIVK